METEKNIYMNDGVFDKFKIEDFLTPTNNSTVKMNMFWITFDGYVFQHKLTKAWQCNANESIVKQISESYRVPYKLIPVMYIKS